MREYTAQLRGKEVTIVKRHRSRAEMIAAMLAKYPDMLPYADTAKIDRFYDVKSGQWHEVITITCFDKRKDEGK